MQNLPNIGDRVPIALHRAPRGQPVLVQNRLGALDRVEHLRRQRVALSEPDPVVGALFVNPHPVTGNDPPEAVRVRPVGERMDRLVLTDVAQRLHVLDFVRWNVAAGSEQQHSGLFGHAGCKKARLIYFAVRNYNKATHVFSV